jgi:hypothetical protein
MRAILLIVLAAIVVVGGLRFAGVPMPFLDYAVGPFGEGRGPAVPDIQIEAPGYDEFEAP